MLTCRFCGYTGDSDDFDFCKDGSGYWCPDCDGLTFVSSEIEQQRRRMVLILETGGAKNEIPIEKTNLRKRLSPLRYPGGKSRLIDQIYSILSKDKMDTFVEVFAGGASLGLSLLDAGCINRLVLNDLDPMVHTFWDIVLHSPDALISRIKSTPITMEAFHRAKEVFSNCRSMYYAPEIVAWAFFLLNRTCFGGILSAGPISGKNSSDAQLSVRWNPVGLCKRIEDIHAMSDKISLCKVDALELFLHNDMWWDEHTTFFVDPPYVKMGDKLYSEKFPQSKHIALAETINELYAIYPNPDIIITYDDCPLVRELYPWAEVREVSRAYSLTPPKKAAG